MQTKRYSRNVEETIAAGATFGVANIVNNDNNTANFHGIRYWCRLRADNASADNEAHGIVAIYCKSSSAYASLAESAFDSDTNLQDLSNEIMAIVPWAVFGGSTNPVGAGTFQDVEVNFKTSRNCGRGGSILVRVVNYGESAKSIIVSNSLLSCFQTVK